MVVQTGSGSVQICALDDVAWQRIGKHRGPGLKMKSLSFRDDGRGHNLWLSLSEMEDGWYSPRHMHNFDQIRYVVEGETNFTDWVLRAGECAYFPAGVSYGPQQQYGSALLFTLQFPGSGGQYYLTPEQVQDTVARLRAVDPDFGSNGKGTDPQGRARDSFEIVWETHQHRPVEYPGSDLAGPVLFDRTDPATDPYIDGGEITRVGQIEANGLQVLRVTGDSSLRITPATPTTAEFWILEHGAAYLDGHELRPLTVLQLQAGAPELTLTLAPDTRFTTWRLPHLTTT